MADVEVPDEARRSGSRTPPAGALHRVRRAAPGVRLAAAIVVPVVGLLGVLYLLVGQRVWFAVAAGLGVMGGFYLGARRGTSR